MKHIELFGGKPSSHNNQETYYKHTKNDEIVVKNTTLGLDDI